MLIGTTVVKPVQFAGNQIIEADDGMGLAPLLLTSLCFSSGDPLPTSFSQPSRQAYYIAHGDIDRLREETLNPLPSLLEEEGLPEGEGPPWPRKEVMELVEAVKAQGEMHLLDAVLSDLARFVCVCVCACVCVCVCVCMVCGVLASHTYVHR